MTQTVATHYRPWDFECRLVYARRAARLSAREEQFLDDVEGRYRQYGHGMFFSEKQRRYLQTLAVRGGWRKHLDTEQPYYPFVEAAYA